MSVDAPGRRAAGAAGRRAAGVPGRRAADAPGRRAAGVPGRRAADAAGPRRAGGVTPGRGRPWRGSSLPVQIGVLTARSLRALVVEPRMFLVTVVGPLLMLLVCSQVFASVAAAPGFPERMRYVDFLVPAFMVNAALQAAVNTGVVLTEEVRNGIVARFRSLPIWLGSVLLARSLADLIRNALQLGALLAAAVALFGFRPGGGVLGVSCALAVALLVGGSLGWVFIALACWVRNAEVMQGSIAFLMLPLMFASNAFVPLEGLPGWLQVVARWNPLTYGIQATRGLTAGDAVGSSALVAVAGGLVIALLAVPVAVRGFRRPL